jgi:putative CocE/NonD family hydrolase
VRLCDVDEKGKSVNVSDGIVRIDPAATIEKTDGAYHLAIEMYPTAYRFKRNHRLRVQVSSGSFPHYIRNYGTGEPIATATQMKIAHQTIFISPTRPSSVSMTIRQ